MIDNLSILFRINVYVSIDEILLSRYVYWSNNFRGLLLKLDMAQSCSKLTNCVLFAFRLRLMPPTAASYKLGSRDSSFVISAISSPLFQSVLLSEIFHLYFPVFNMQPFSSFFFAQLTFEVCSLWIIMVQMYLLARQCKSRSRHQLSEPLISRFCKVSL